MTFQDYLALPGLNSTPIKAGVTSMLHMHYAMTQPSKPATVAMAMGTLTHSVVLEPTTLPLLCAVWEGGDRRGSGYAAFVAANPGKIITKPGDLTNVKCMMNAVQANPKARELLEGCTYESTVEWSTDQYGAAKCRLDAVKPGCLVDLKTVRSITRRKLERQALDLGYDIQMGWYGLGCAESGLGDVAGDTWLLYVESVPPYDVLPLKVGYDVIERGQRRAVQIATRYRECEAAGVWPGVATERDVWSLPEWALLEEDADRQGADNG